jgi:acetyl esterase
LIVAADPTAVSDLDPELRPVVDDVAAQLPGWHTLPVEEARHLEDELFSAGTGPAMATVEDHTVEADDGRSIPVREYHPEEVATEVPLVYAHGGGFVLGTLDSTDDVCRHLAARLGCPVRSVDYRLAPEHPFPAAVDDVWTVTRATAEGTTGPVAVGGASAGGCLAALAALQAREMPVDVAAQLLLYPMLDPELNRAAHEGHADGPLLTRADLAWFWEQYVPDGGPEAADAAVPVTPLATDLAGVAPAVVATAGTDPLRDDGRAYADRLAAAGVDVADLRYPSLCHGFASLGDRVPAAESAVAEVVAAVRERVP